MIKTKRLLTISTLLAFISASADEDISYTWAEINYETNKPGIAITGQAISLASSFSIYKNFYIVADVSKTQNSSLSIKENSYNLSLGFHQSITDNTDLYTELGYIRKDPDFFQAVNAAEIVVGSRTIISPDFELITSLNYKDYETTNNFLNDTTDGGIGFGVEGLYKMTDTTHLHFGLNHEDSITSPVVGIRWNW